MHVQGNASLRARNTLALPGRAAHLVEVFGDEEARVALDWAGARELPVIPLGEGSNIVLAGNLQALVIRQCTSGRELLAREPDKVLLRVAAGENWHALVAWTLEQGYHGLENLALIPGTVGAAPIQNIGAYGVELESVLETVHALRIADGARVQLSRDECRFGYRDSIFKGELRDRLLITAVDLALRLQPNVEATYPSLGNYLREAGITDPGPREVFDAVVAIRRSRLPDPATEPNAGSFFKNPRLDAAAAARLRERFPGLPCYPQADGSVKIAAAWMIEQCGFKGVRRGEVGVHAEHALVLVNYGSGDGEALLALAAEIARAVRETFGIELALEPRVYGREP